MAKDAMTITIDRHLHDWIKEKGGNKSKIVNSLLHTSWINEGNKKRSTPSLAQMDRNLKDHMAKMWRSMGYSDDGMCSKCVGNPICECDEE